MKLSFYCWEQPILLWCAAKHSFPSSAELTGMPHKLHDQGYWQFPDLTMAWAQYIHSVLDSPLLTLDIKQWHVVINKNIFGKTPQLYSCSVTCCQETIPHFLLTQRNTSKFPTLQGRTKNKCNIPRETLLASPNFKSSFLFRWEDGKQDHYKLPQCLTIAPKRAFLLLVQMLNEQFPMVTV